MSASIITIPARSGKAAYAEAGQRIKVINTHGQQVVDTWAFRRDNLKEYHDNCTDNLSAGMKELGLEEPETPSPLNLFMNIPWTPDGELSWEEPVSTPGSYILLKAEMDLVIAFSACPQDILPINGRVGKPTEAHFQILD